MYLTLVRAAHYNARNYQCLCNGSDDTTNLLALIAVVSAAGGGIIDLPGPTGVSSPITLPYAVRLSGVGVGSGLVPLSTFSGTQIVLCNGDFSGLQDMTIAYTNTTYSSNPSANGIQITGARSVYLSNVALNYINGYAVQSTATSSIANYWGIMNNVHAFQCAKGGHLLGNAGSSFNMGAYIVNCNFDQIANGDGLLIEDAHDVTVTNLEGNVITGSGYSTLHITGASAAVYITNFDQGPAPGPSAGSELLIDSGSNGSPKQITISGGIVEGGTYGINIAAGTQIKLIGVDIINNGTIGVNISGGDDILLDACMFNLNGSAGSSGRYDFQSSTTGNVDVNDCVFRTANGSTFQTTNNAVNVTAGNVRFHNTAFRGTGYSSANIFLGYPRSIRNCPGYNPLGAITAPSIPATGIAAPYYASDMTVYVTGGTVSSIDVNSTATGLTSGTFRVLAQTPIVLNYTVAPTWVWISD